MRPGLFSGRICTQTRSPTLTTSFTVSTRRGASAEMCTSAEWRPPRSTKAPKDSIRTTLPCTMAPSTGAGAAGAAGAGTIRRSSSRRRGGEFSRLPSRRRRGERSRLLSRRRGEFCGSRRLGGERWRRGDLLSRRGERLREEDEEERDDDAERDGAIFPGTASTQNSRRPRWRFFCK